MQLPSLSFMNRQDRAGGAGGHLGDTLWQDLLYAFRSLRKSPGYAIAALLLLALGIGATTAIFSVVYALLLRPLPYREPQRLVRIMRSADASDVSIPEYEFWKDHSSAYASVAAHGFQIAQNLDTDTEPLWIQTVPVTAGFFSTLGVEPLLGREFTSAETTPNGPRSIILTDGLWRRAFSARPDIIGRTVALDDAAYTVAGVLPPSFWFPVPAEAFVPLRVIGAPDEKGTNTGMIGRLRAGVSVRQAEAEDGPLTRAFLQTGAIKTLPNYRGLIPRYFQDAWAGDNRDGVESRTPVLTLFGAVLLLLLIACSNLAGLLFARLASKRKEIAIRLALGSSASRLVRQYLLENLLLSLAGGVAGLLTADWLLQGLLALIPFHLAVPGSPELNRDVLLFAIAATVGTNLAFGIVPLLASSRVDVADGLKSETHASTPRQRIRSLLVAGEVALSAMLLISAGLLTESLYRLRQEKLGFSPDGLMTFSTPVSRARRGKAAELRRFEAAVLDRIERLPGVRSAGGINYLPLGGRNNFPVQPEGHPEQQIGATEVRAVTPGYFETMGIPLLRGRVLDERDAENSPLVALVSQSLAARWWPDGNPIGHKVTIGEGSFTVVGVVGDTKRLNVKEAFRPTVYMTPEQRDWTEGMSWAMRGTFSAGFADELQQAIHEIDPKQRVLRIQTMNEMVASSTADSRFDAWIFGAFAGVALLLAAVGVYGLLSFAVARRANEIGTRMALGAASTNVVSLILRQGFTPIAAGLAVGLLGAFFATRALGSLLFGVKQADPLSYIAAAVALLLAGALASYIPARRAAKVDPMIALRSE